MAIISKYRPVVLCGILAIGCATSACDGDNSKLNNGSNNQKHADVEDTAETHSDQDASLPTPDEDAGPDTEERADVPTAPGFMNGAWQVTQTDDDALLTSFDLTQVEGNPTIEGGYLTGPGLYDGLFEGGVGVLAESSFDGSTLSIKWNPTTQDVEEFTLNATKVDDNTFNGTITAVQNTGLDLSVKVTREADAPGH